MHISRKKLPKKHQYDLDGQSLEQVTNIKDLGITVSSNLSWSKHVEETAAKANSPTLRLLKRIWTHQEDINDCATRRLLYCSLVRLKLEYASNVWSPSTVKHLSLIENIQRRATKFILNYSKNMSYQEILIKTNLLPLELRREILDLHLFYKYKSRLIPMDVNTYLRTYDPSYTSRHYDENNFYSLPHKSRTTSGIRFL
jgi:hypothetical protein